MLVSSDTTRDNFSEKLGLAVAQRNEVSELAVADTSDALAKMQAQVLEYRSLAASGRFDAETTRVFIWLADQVEDWAKELEPHL
jgi:hypothetical protein